MGSRNRHARDADEPSRQRAEDWATKHRTTEVGPGPLELDVVFTPPPGQHLDDRYGPATRLLVTATPPELLAQGAGPGDELCRRLVLAGSPDSPVEGVLHVTATAASCDTEGEYPACHLHQQDWGIPLRLVPGAAQRLALVLRGRTEPGAGG